MYYTIYSTTVMLAMFPLPFKMRKLKLRIENTPKETHQLHENTHISQVTISHVAKHWLMETLLIRNRFFIYIYKISYKFCSTL